MRSGWLTDVHPGALEDAPIVGASSSGRTIPAARAHIMIFVNIEKLSHIFPRLL